jgi:hypothetical protein
VKDVDMATSPELKIRHFDDAATARLLRLKLEPARRDLANAPSADAVDRIRARVFGTPALSRRHRSIAA